MMYDSRQSQARTDFRSLSLDAMIESTLRDLYQKRAQLETSIGILEAELKGTAKLPRLKKH